MAKLVTKFKYLKPNARTGAGGYAKYIATREGVEKIDDSLKELLATKKQQLFIQKLINDFPDTKQMLEYEDYISSQTMGNASEFITRALEENRGEMEERKTYADYIATRPRAERFGSHGLFTTDGVPVDLEKVSQELNDYEGNVWTVIISLRRPDAERLGFNAGSRWRDMLRTQEEALSSALNIPLTNLKWFGAFHNESHHPHVHLIAYSKNKNEGYLTQKGVKNLRSSFAKDIFMQDNLSLYEKETEYRDQLSTDSKVLIAEIVQKINSGGCDNPVLEEKLMQLAVRLSNTKGKKVYGYLKADVKAVVDSIVDEFASDERIAALYHLWYEQREAVINTYTEEIPERVPLSKNTEFKPVRNAVIREAMNLIMDRQAVSAGDVLSAEEVYETLQKYEVQEEDDPDAPVECDEERDPYRWRSDFSSNHSWWTARYKHARHCLYGSVEMKPDFELAMQLLLEEAEDGNGFAMYDVGTMILSGWGCEVDEEAAQGWFEKAYHAFVQEERNTNKPGYLRYRIGKLCALGHGVPQDYLGAAKWYERAVEEKNPFAAYALGSLYRRGQGVRWDSQKAFELFELAASDEKKPNAYAAYELGKMCRDGIGTDPDIEQSERWFCQAYRGFVKIAQRMADEKLFYRLGQMCMTGTGTEVDYTQARKYLEKAAELDHLGAFYSLGKLYLKKDNEEYDPQKALYYLKKAADKNHSFALYWLGCLYFYGTEIERDERKGIAYLTAAALQGNAYAEQLLENIRAEQKWSAVVGASGLLQSLSRIIISRLEVEKKGERKTIDRKLRKKIEEKKQAQGLRLG